MTTTADARIRPASTGRDRSPDSGTGSEHARSRIPSIPRETSVLPVPSTSLAFRLVNITSFSSGDTHKPSTFRAQTPHPKTRREPWTRARNHLKPGRSDLQVANPTSRSSRARATFANGSLLLPPDCEILRQSLTEPLVSLTLERAPRGKLAATQRRLLVDGLRDENGLRVGLFPLAYLGIAHRFPLKRSRAGMPWCLQIIRRTGGLAVTPHSTADSQLNPVIDYTRKRPESQRENPQWWRPHFGGNRRRQWVRREPHPPLRGHPNAKGMAKPSS
jgi:hypothetical protein